MHPAFQEIDETEYALPEELKEQLVSEIDLIRNALQIFQMFSGEPLETIALYAQIFEPDTPPSSHESIS
ncbi:MAG: hypothetical protein ACK4LB_14495 [Spirosomataceae bacterium]